MLARIYRYSLARSPFSVLTIAYSWGGSEVGSVNFLMIHGWLRFRSRSPFRAVSSVFRLPPNSTVRQGLRRRLLLAGSALTLATGIWSMHFVGMLAADFPSAIDYLVLPTLVSFLICVIVVGRRRLRRACPRPAECCASAAARRRWGSAFRSCTMSACRAVHLAGPTIQETPFVVASVRCRSRRAPLR